MDNNPIQTNRFCWVKKIPGNQLSPGGFDKQISSESWTFYFSQYGTCYYLMIDHILQNLAPFNPLYHYHDEHNEVVTSDFSCLLPLLDKQKIEEHALREFILYNTPLDNRTFYSNVNRIHGISEIRYNKENNLFQIDAFNSAENESHLDAIFSERVESFLNNAKDLHHVIFLSGGYESRINAAIAAFYGLKTTLVTWGHPEDIEFIIAQKIARELRFPHINIRPDTSSLPYMEYARKTGFISNIQYAYRYRAVQMVKEMTGADVLWSGWGDINGFPAPGKPTELFTSWFQARARGNEYNPMGWNARWLANGAKVDFPFDIDPEKPVPGVMEANRTTLAPLIFGQVLGAENTLLQVFAPWHHPDIYSAIGKMEEKYPRLLKNKYSRVLFKGRMYYNLLKKYKKELNLIPVSKRFYPFWFHPAFGPLAPALAGLQKKLTRKRKFPFDPVEDREFLKKELDSIIISDIIYFDKEQIGLLVDNSAHWSGPDIMEIFKIIQVYWFSKSLDEK